MNILMAKRAINLSVHRGGVAAMVSSYNFLPREQLIRQTVLAQQGDEAAMRAVIDGCSKLVLSVTRRVWLQWASQLPDSAQFDDVFQAGLEGLFVAVGKFDESRGNTLTTMASLWIQNKAQRTIFPMIGICHIPETMISSGTAQDTQLLARRCISIETSLIEDAETLVHRLMGAEDDHDCGAQDILVVLARVDERLPAIAQLLSEGYSDDEVAEMFSLSREWIRQLRLKAARALCEAGLV